MSRSSASSRKTTCKQVPWSLSYLQLQIGGASLYLIDRYKEGETIYSIDFEWIESVDIQPKGCGFQHTLDHLTHNIYRGRMGYCVSTSFREIRYFDIKGEYNDSTRREN